MVIGGGENRVDSGECDKSVSRRKRRKTMKMVIEREKRVKTATTRTWRNG